MKRKLILGALCAANLLPLVPVTMVANAQDDVLVKGAPKRLDGKLAPNEKAVFTAPTGVRPLKVAIYEGTGSGNSGIDSVCTRVESLGNATVTRLTAEQIANGDLSGYDVIAFTGGMGSQQAKAIGESGRENVRKFVYNGGSYLGICAGAYLATAGYPWSLGILNAKTISPKWARGRAFLKMELSDEGRQTLGDVREKFFVRYNNGPVIEPAKNPDLPPYQVWAYFRNEVAENNSPKGVMVNSPAIVSGTYGKGRVLSISPHPEDTKGLENVIPLGMKWLSEAGDRK